MECLLTMTSGLVALGGVALGYVVAKKGWL